MNKIKIVFFLQSLGGGGAEKSMVNLINNMDRKIFDVFLFLGNARGVFIQDISNETQIINLSSSHISFALFKLIRRFRLMRPDIVVSALPHVNIISILAKILSKSSAKFIITERSTFSKISSCSATRISHKLLARFVFPILIKIFYPRADAVVCVSRGVAEDLSGIIKNLPKIRIIFNPVVSDKINILS